MKRHKKRAALQYVALVYFSFLALTLGTLRCAQKTRQALYGGQPAMAQITAKSEFSINEWNLLLSHTRICFIF